MGEVNTPIDVISICSADGKIRPLRFRLERENRERLRVNIDKILSTRRVPYVGVEADIFLCRAMVDGAEQIFELKYAIRSHCWFLTQRVY